MTKSDLVAVVANKVRKPFCEACLTRSSVSGRASGSPPAKLIWNPGSTSSFREEIKSFHCSGEGSSGLRGRRPLLPL